MRFCFDWPQCVTCDGEPPTVGRVLHLFLDQDNYPGMPAALVATLENVTAKKVPKSGALVDGYEFCVNVPDEQMPEINGQLVRVLDQCAIDYIDCVDCCEVLTVRVDDLEQLLEEQTAQVVTSVVPDCSTGQLRIKVTTRTLTWFGQPLGLSTDTYHAVPCLGYGGYGYGYGAGAGDTPNPPSEDDFDPNPSP